MSAIAFHWLLTLVPSLPFLFLYLASRRVLFAKKFEMQMLLKRGETLTKYLSAYGGSGSGFGTEAEKETQIRTIVDQLFQLRYSTLEYLPAILFSVLVTAILVILGLSFANIQLGLPLEVALAGNKNVGNIVAGGIGALIWGIYELSERYHSGDLPPDALFTVGTRVIAVGAVGAVVGVVVESRLAWAVAFGVGILPMSTVKEYVSDKTQRALGISGRSKIQASPPLTLLQGWNTELSERLARADISSVEELACGNQFQLYLRSNLDWRVILDLSDQALLILYVAEGIEKLRPLGIRSAVELAEINWSRDDADFFVDFDHEQAIERVASALGMEETSVRLLISSLSTDATANFLAALWSDATPDDEE